MSINKLKNKVVSQLQLGEFPINHAPYVSLEHGIQCIPQHYLQYQHNRESVELLVVDIEYWHNFIVLVDEDKSGIYLQIAVIGIDNYPSANYAVTPDKLSVKQHRLANSETTSATKKVVYGRKWRVEKELPTSEIIQTAFLALKTAREHEIRELFRLQHKGALTTPFNNHHDLPVMAKLLTARCTNTPVDTDLACLPLDEQLQRINHALALISYDSACFAVQQHTGNKLAIERRYNGDWLIDIKLLANSDTQLAEVVTKRTASTASKPTPLGYTVLTLIVSSLSINKIYFNLMRLLINLSDQHVAENFSYRGFKRFSSENSILQIAELSTDLRQKNGTQKDSFISEFIKSNNTVDAARVPELRPGKLAQKVAKKMSQFDQLQGFIPKLISQ
jgi:hypothetical protein